MKQTNIITFMSAKGGVGQTFLSSHFAKIKAVKAKTLFLQLNNYPDIYSSLHLSDDTHLLHLIEFLLNDEAPEHALQKILKSKDGLAILSTPNKLSLTKKITSEHIINTINLLSNYFDCIVIDLSTDFEHQVDILQLSNEVFCITTLDPNSIYTLKQLRASNSLKNSKIILNQLPSGITFKEAQKYVNENIIAWVPQEISEAWFATVNSQFVSQKSGIASALSKLEVKHT